ncbi:MAG: YitT family protein, partial [Anaerovoracaceae bacterium]
MEKKKKLKKIFTKENIKGFFIDLFFIVLACCVGAFSVVAIMIPNGLTAGGLTGIVRIVQTFIPIDFSILYYMGTAIIIILVWIFLGFKMVQKILILSVLYPTILLLFENLTFQLLETKDLILAAVFYGILAGVSNGLVHWRGYSFAATDAIAKILRKKLMPQVSQSKIMLIIDATIIICSAFIFGRNIALYALISQVIVTKTMDVIMFGFESKIVQLQIITQKGDEIVDYIVEEVGRGVSCHEVLGGYSKQNFKELRLLCSP